MNMFLYPADEQKFDTNGLGSLNDAIDAEVLEEINGQFELTVRYPVDGNHFSEIAMECYIAAKPSPERAHQPFRIYRITKPMHGIVTIYARHNAYRLNRFVATPLLYYLGSPEKAFAKMKTKIVPECPFEFESDITTRGELFKWVPTDVWTLLGSTEGCFMDLYGGEYEFDRFTVKLLQRRGKDRSVSIRYGKNLRSLQQDENVANVYNGVYPYYSVHVDYVELPERYLMADGEWTEPKILPLDLSDQFEEKPTEDELREAALIYMAIHEIGKPEVSLTVDFVVLSQTEEYKNLEMLESVELGDTVRVYFPKLSIESESRVMAIRYNPITGRYKRITLGKVKPTLATTVAQSKLEIGKAETAGSLQALVEKYTSWLTGGKGYIVAVQADSGVWKELCVLDAPDIQTAEKVWKWGAAGLSYSGTGYTGEFRQVLTMDGKLLSADGSIIVDLVNNEITLDGRKLGWLNQGGYSYLVGLDE